MSKIKKDTKKDSGGGCGGTGYAPMDEYNTEERRHQEILMILKDIANVLRDKK